MELILVKITLQTGPPRADTTPMGAPAVAFVDHYGILGVDAKATNNAIHQAYSALAAKYHPNNKESGDKEKYEAVTTAYETLSDPAARKAYDSVKSGGVEDIPINFDPDEFLAGMGQDTGRRMCLLSMLYDRRKQSPRTPGIPIRLIETLTTFSGLELTFCTWYLKQKGLVTSDDKSNLVITVEGMDYLEANRPDAASIRPFLKPKEEAKPRPATTHQAFPVKALKPAVGATLSRALANLGASRAS